MKVEARLAARIFGGAFALLLLLVTPLGCASSGGRIVHAPVPSSARANLFPNGTYRHQIHVALTNGTSSGPQTFGFDGIVQISPAFIRVTALSAFSTTLFKLTEDRATGEIKTEVSADPFRPLEPRLREYYSILRIVLTAPATTPAPGSGLEMIHARDDGFPLEMRITQKGKVSILRFSEYDANQIPGKIEIVSPQYTVEVRVSGYEI